MLENLKPTDLGSISTCYLPTHGYSDNNQQHMIIGDGESKDRLMNGAQLHLKQHMSFKPSNNLQQRERSTTPSVDMEGLNLDDGAYATIGYEAVSRAAAEMAKRPARFGTEIPNKLGLPTSVFQRRRSVVHRSPSELIEDMEPKRLQRAIIELLKRNTDEHHPNSASKGGTVGFQETSVNLNVADILSEYVASSSSSSSPSASGVFAPITLPHEAWASISPSPRPRPTYSAPSIFIPPPSPRKNQFYSLGHRDWNREWQEMRTQLDELEAQRERENRSPLDKDSELRAILTSAQKLMEDFYYAAKAYARIIISEFALPDDQKTIPKANLGGMAGGEKYICKGILFKFAQDKVIATLSDKKPLWMYGGDHPDDRFAIKAAAKEFLGLETFVAQNSDPSLCYALTVLIDYKGFRLIATPMLPIDSSTIVYGSNDSGNVIHTDDPEVNKKIEQVAARMKIKAHFVGVSKDRAKLLHAPGDIEVHRGKDGLIYLLDFGRFLPPEAPCADPKVASRPEERRSIFYKFLRPEFSIFYHKPLSPDAFSAWTTFDPFREQNEQDLREATEKLYNEVIPAFAREFQEQPLRLDVDLASLMEQICIRVRLVARARFHGINMRHLGRVRRELTSEDHRKLVLSNCISRVIKNLIREEMRVTMKTSMGTPTDLPFRKVVVRMINIVLGRSGDLSTQFWSHEVKEHLQSMFHHILTSEETAPEFDLHSRLDIRIVLFFLSSSLGIVFNSDAFRELMECTEEFEMLVSDIAELIPTTRQMYFNYTYASRLARLSAQETANIHAGRRLLYSAHNNCAVASVLMPKCPIHCLECSYLGLTVIQKKLEAYRLEPTEAYHDLIESHFDTAFVQTEQSMESFLIPANVNQWVKLGEAFADWKRSKGEEAIAQEYEKKVLELKGLLLRPSSSSCSSCSSSSPSRSTPTQVEMMSDVVEDTSACHKSSMGTCYLEQEKEKGMGLTHFRENLRIRHSSFQLPVEKTPFTSVCGLNVDDFLNFARVG